MPKPYTSVTIYVKCSTTGLGIDGVHVHLDKRFSGGGYYDGDTSGGGIVNFPAVISGNYDVEVWSSDEHSDLIDQKVGFYGTSDSATEWPSCNHS